MLRAGTARPGDGGIGFDKLPAREGDLRTNRHAGKALGEGSASGVKFPEMSRLGSTLSSFRVTPLP
jgi:hypothetical protein